MRLPAMKWSIYHVFVACFTILMLYPVIWFIMSSFKPTDTIFLTAD